MEQSPTFDRGSRNSVRLDRRGSPSLWRPVIALIVCLALIGIGLFILSHLGLTGLAPLDPNDAYYAT